MITRAAYALLVVACLATPALSDGAGKCKCRANGKDFFEGEIACLKLPSGTQLARCEKVLNNTSWKSLGEGCPSASAASDARIAALCLRPIAAAPHAAGKT